MMLKLKVYIVVFILIVCFVLVLIVFNGVIDVYDYNWIVDFDFDKFEISVKVYYLFYKMIEYLWIKVLIVVFGDSWVCVL